MSHGRERSAGDGPSVKIRRMVRSTTLFVVMLLAGTAQAAVLGVPGDHATIQAAADAAADGDELRIGPGRHCGAVIRKRLVLSAAGAGRAVIVGCAGGPRVHGELRVGFLLDGADGHSPASGTTISGLSFDGAGVSGNDLRPLAFAVLGRFADDVVVSGNSIDGTVQAITNTGGDRWTVTQNHIMDLTVFDCARLCGGGSAIVMQRARADLALPGGSLNAGNRPEGNTIADNRITGGAPESFDAFMLAGVLVVAADATVVFGNRVALRTPGGPAGEVAAAAVLVDSRTAADDDGQAVPGARGTSVERNDGGDSQHAVVVGGARGSGANTDRLLLDGNVGALVVEGTLLSSAP